jgi:RNA polymerase sigma-70 factor (ECF subfamily)
MTVLAMHATDLGCDPAEAFAHHQAWLRTVLMARLGNREEADEVLQEVALAAANHSARGQAVDRVGPWLYRVALRQILLLRRKQGRRRRLLAEVAANSPPEPVQRTHSPLDWVLSQERSQLVRAAMALLGERDRQLLLLKYVDGLSYEQIGQALGVTASSVQSRLHRARNVLRQRLLAAQIDASTLA